jgi:hypothetical protein
METEPGRDRKSIGWHPAFFEAVRMELGGYDNELEFIPELPLTAEPLKIDAVIIKKRRGVQIKKNIGAAFRKVNILEYKSPGGYFSVTGFYKAYGYACLYQSIYKEDIREMTLSLVGSRHPRKLLAHLQEARKYTVEEKQPGIYIVKGDVMPVQIIDVRKLAVEENLWLNSLRRKLDRNAVGRVIEERERQKKDAGYSAYFDVIFRANPETFKEAMEMRGAPTLMQLIMETKVGASVFAEMEARCRAESLQKGRAEGMEKGRAEGRLNEKLEIARKMKETGDSIEKIQAITGLDIKTVNRLRKKKVKNDK